MINKFLTELDNKLKENNIDNCDLIERYTELYDKYVSLGQSEFDIIRHFGEPSEIVETYIKNGDVGLPDMDSKLDFEFPEYLEEKQEVKEDKVIKRENIAPETKAGLILNDIFFVGLGILFAIAGIIALGTVSILMTATSVVQLVKVWEMATVGQRVGGFFLSLMALAMTIVFYYFIVWIVKTIINFMKRYVHDHKENWAKCVEREVKE